MFPRIVCLPPGRYRSYALGLLAVVGFFTGRSLPVAGATVTSRQVVRAIKRGVHYLLKHEKPGNCWDRGIFDSGYFRQRGGRTAMATQTLLEVGQSLDLRELNIFSPKMRAAIAYTAGIHSIDTYVVSFQANAMALLPHKPEYLAVLRRDYKLLREGMKRGGGYSYRLKKTKAGAHAIILSQGWDNSNTQYGVLGMWAVAHAGLRVPMSYWDSVKMHWRAFQYSDGTWGYASHADRPAQGVLSSRPDSMTPAGLASLLIADEYERSTSPDRSIGRGLAWLGRHIHPHIGDTYTLYGYARVGMASGLQYFGRTNWYRSIAARLLRHQRHNGSWGAGITGPPRVHNRIVGTCYALLTLARGLNPVFLNKLQYSPGYYGSWNRYPRDVGNLTAWISRTYEHPMNWQVVNCASPVREWLNSPVLYISGSQDPKFTKTDVAKIRRYIHAGGIVFSNSNNGSTAFTNAMERYAREVVHNRYPVQTLSVKSSIYTLQSYYHLQNQGLLAISNGSRYLWIISPVDFANAWQQRAHLNESYWQIPLNLYLYATGKVALANKLTSLHVPSARRKPVRTIHIALIKYHGNWNPEPGAWPRMARLAALQFSTHLVLTSERVGRLNAAITPMAHITGTGSFHLTPKQITHLRVFLAHGGVLFGDATGGGVAFSRSFEQLVRQLYPSLEAMSKLRRRSAVYRGTMPGGISAVRVQYRKFYTKKHGVKTRPELLGVKKGGRWRVLYSPDDITSGLLGTNTWGLSGYAPASAQVLARDIILYAAKTKVKPATRPGTPLPGPTPTKSAGSVSSSSRPGM